MNFTRNIATAAVASFAATVALPAAAAETGSLEWALKAPAADVVSACAAASISRDFLRLAEAGMEVVIDGRPVNKRNVDKVRAQLDARLAACRAAIAQRGVQPLAGPWVATASGCDQSGSPLPKLLAGEQSHLTITQPDAAVAMRIHGIYDGDPVDFSLTGTMVESAMVFIDPSNSDYPWLGEAKATEVVLRPDTGRVLAAWPRWAGPPRRADLEACRIVLKPVAIAAGGDYAGIDTRLADETVAALQYGKPEAKQAAAKAVQEAPGSHSPVVLGALAEWLAASGDRTGAGFWYQAARLRALEDAQRSADLSTVAAVERLFPATKGLALQPLDAPATADALAERVVAWDKANPAAYDIRWINLYGDDATTAARHAGGATTKALMLPKEQWDAAVERARQAYLATFAELLAKQRARDAIPQWHWEKVTEGGVTAQVAFYVDFTTLRTTDGMRRVWEVRDRKQPSSTGAMSYLCENEYDCAGKRFRGLFFEAYKSPMGEGERIDRDLRTDEWNDITPGAPADKILQAICTRQ